MLMVCLLGLCPPGANQMNYSRIESGMTRSQVLVIVRQDPVANVLQNDRVLAGTLGILGTFEIMSRGELWRTGRTQLWVLFDEDQRVTGKMLDENNSPPTDLFQSVTGLTSPW